jgi:hypothetical protein
LNIKPMESEMTKMKTLCAGIAAATMLATPALAQEATQEPGAMGQHYPNSDYLTGGYGSRATPGPRYYYWRDHRPVVYGPAGVAVGVVGGAIGAAGVIAAAPFEGPGPYAYYDGPDY